MINLQQVLQGGCHGSMNCRFFSIETIIAKSQLLFAVNITAAVLLTPQVRVMPNCLYVLLRFLLRVDRTLVRLRDARVFCDLRQVRYMLCTMAMCSIKSPVCSITPVF